MKTFSQQKRHEASAKFRKQDPLTTYTPTPWKIGTWKDEKGDRTVIKSGAVVVADIQWQLNDAEEANAAFIVRAVNAYEKDQETIRQLLKAIKIQMCWTMRDGTLCNCPCGQNEDEPHGSMQTIHSTVCYEARIAIARAEGK